MENSTIVAFHIGRGGRFYNAGHLSYIGKHSISDFTSDLYTQYENESEIYKMLKSRNLTNLIEKFDECVANERDFSFFETKFELDFGDLIYVTCGGWTVGLTQDDADSGIGTINIDNDYDTTYTLHIQDCDIKELKLIKDNDLYEEYLSLNEIAQDVIDLAKSFDLLYDICTDSDVFLIPCTIDEFINFYDITEVTKDEYIGDDENEIIEVNQRYFKK